MNAKGFLLFGAAGGALSVALGAFGAHILRGRLPDSLLAVYHTASQYLIYHSLALLVVGLLLQNRPNQLGLRVSGYLFLAGSLLFSGSLYLLALSGVRGIGMITPLGGLSLLGGWLALVVTLYRDADKARAHD